MHCYSYDAWANECYKVEAGACEEGTRLSVVLEPRKSLIVLFDEADETLLREPVCCRGERTEIVRWKRSTCEAAAYPDFRGDREVLLPDGLAEEQPPFSGFVRYEASFWVKAAGQQPGEPESLLLELTGASEGVEVFVNGRSASIQIIPVYRYDITDFVQAGENKIVIEVATTLERKCYDMTKDDPRMKMRGLAEPKCGSGITGQVFLYTVCKNANVSGCSTVSGMPGQGAAFSVSLPL